MLYSIRYGSDYIKSSTKLLWLTVDEKFTLNLMVNFKEEIGMVVRDPLPEIESLANSLGYEQKNYYCSKESSWNGLMSFMMGAYNSGIWGVIHNFSRLGD